MSGPEALTNDPRVARARALTVALADARAGALERARIVQELRDEGHRLSAIAAALGITRQRLYAITNGRPGGDGPT